MLQDMNTQVSNGFHICIAKTHSINFNCWGGPSMWAEFGAIHGVPWMEAATQRCHILQGDLALCAMDDPLVLKEHWKPGFLLPKNIHTKKYFKPKQFWEWRGKSNNQLKAQTTSDMTKDAIWPACLDLYHVCFIVSRYGKSFFFPSALGTWLSADARVVAGKH